MLGPKTKNLEEALLANQWRAQYSILPRLLEKRAMFRLLIF